MPILDPVGEVRPTGNDLNGCLYQASFAGTDYSQQDAPQLAVTDGACLMGATTLNSVTGGFTAAMVGNGIGISGGVNFVWAIYMIVAYIDTNNVTLDRTPSPSGIGATGVVNVGGALATPLPALNQSTLYGPTPPVYDGMLIWIKKGTYAYDNSVDGPLQISGSPTLNFPIRVVGYNLARGDNPLGGNRPTIAATGTPSAAQGVLYVTGYSFIFENLSFDGAGLLDYGIWCHSPSYGNIFINVSCTNALTWGVWDDNGNNIWERCTCFSNGSTAQTGTSDAVSGGFLDNSGSKYLECVAFDNTGAGFDGSGARVERCESYGNNGAGFVIQANTEVFEHNVAYSNALDGLMILHTDFGQARFYRNNVFAFNTNYGVRAVTGGSSQYDLSNAAYVDTWVNNAFYSNTAGARLLTPVGLGEITLTNDPFNSGASGDFTTNMLATGGKLLRGAGVPVNLDVGSRQSLSPGCGGALVEGSGYQGDIKASSITEIYFRTINSGGDAVAPSSAFTVADVTLFKSGTSTPRASTSGWTMTSPLNSIVGLHRLTVDTSDNTDAGFYAAAHDYRAVLTPSETVDAQTVMEVIGSFSIENRVVNWAQLTSPATVNDLTHTTVNTSYPLHRNTAYAGFRFPMVQAANPQLPATGLSVTGTVGIDTAAEVALTNAVVEVGVTGDYYVDLAVADLNAAREVTLHFTAPGAAPLTIKIPLQD